MSRKRRNIIIGLVIILLITLIVFIYLEANYNLVGKVFFTRPIIRDIFSPPTVPRGKSFELLCNMGEVLPCVSGLHGDNPCKYIRYQGATAVFLCNAINEGVFTNTCRKWVYGPDARCNENRIIMSRQIEIIDYATIIKQDIKDIKERGFDRIRIITTVATEPSLCYSNEEACLSFPNPTQEELESFRTYLKIIDKEDLRYEIVLLMPDSSQEYYNNGITGSDYKDFVDSIWPVMWTGKLDAIIVGGDLSLNPEGIIEDGNFPIKKSIVDSNRQWIKEIWPHMYEKCPTCNTGININTLYAWPADTGVRNILWIKDEFPDKLPKFIAYQYYPTTKEWLTAIGYRKGGENDWQGLVEETHKKLSDAAGEIHLLADEVGLNLDLGWTDQEQSEFYTETISYMINNGIHFNIWEFADHPLNGRYGLMNEDRVPREATNSIKTLLLNKKGVSVGIQYIPPKMHGWEYIERL